MSDSLVELRAVRRSFDGGRVFALDGVDLTIRSGELVAVLGKSGSGKSCLVNIMAGLDRPTSGEVLWRGEPVDGRSRWTALRAAHIGIVFQEFHLVPTLTAVENVELGLFGRGVEAAARRVRALAALDGVGLSARADHLPTAMSGGERQRTAIARALVRDPELLLADEPTGNLDSLNAERIADLMLDLHARRGMTLVCVTHDETLAARFPRRVRMRDGRVVEDVGGSPVAAAEVAA